MHGGASFRSKLHELKKLHDRSLVTYPDNATAMSFTTRIRNLECDESADRLKTLHGVHNELCQLNAQVRKSEEGTAGRKKAIRAASYKKKEVHGNAPLEKRGRNGDFNEHGDAVGHGSHTGGIRGRDVRADADNGEDAVMTDIHIPQAGAGTTTQDTGKHRARLPPAAPKAFGDNSARGRILDERLQQDRKIQLREIQQEKREMMRR
ncbi:Hypothetical protein D9617_189g011790 [Elsinoe fawcettii]|nr:Hypothetical protein D9617_189g011790 [Elsinoe fawcettii]